MNSEQPLKIYIHGIIRVFFGGDLVNAILIPHKLFAHWWLYPCAFVSIPLSNLLPAQKLQPSFENTKLKQWEYCSHFLMRNAGRVLTRSQLIDRVWGGDYFGDTKTLDVHIKRLRSKTEADPANPVLIQTIRGLGYKLEN